MKRQKRNLGFTMMEMLIIVAIIGILSSVGFVAVVNHQKNMVRLEENAVAKEIFVAAQNHLTLARNEGYLGVSGYGGQDTGEAAQGIYYYVVNKGIVDVNTPTEMFELMLPFGSMDEIVRTGGSYLVRYQPKAGLVLDVYYCKAVSQDSRYGHDLASSEYADLVTASKNAGDARTANLAMSGWIAGWYGGQQAEQLVTVKPYDSPFVTVRNAEKLTVEVAITSEMKADSNLTLKLILKGLKSGVEKAFTLKGTSADGAPRVTSAEETDKTKYTVILDDITAADLKFSRLQGKKDGSDTLEYFLPGEDISVQAVAYNNSQLNNLAYSDEQVTNSLFEKTEAQTRVNGSNTTVVNVVSVNNLRHLENLDAAVSGFTGKITYTEGGAAKTWTLDEVVQTSDMGWESFRETINGSAPDGVKVSYYESGDKSTPDGCFKPVNPGFKLVYDAQGHNIEGVKVNDAGAAGLFGTLAAGSSVANLSLINFDIQGGGSVGALAGAVVGGTVSNVVAYNSVKSDSKTTATIRATGTGDTSHAGGLIGVVSADKDGEGNPLNSSIQKSAAALIVSSQGGNAGGLIGTASGATIEGCFSGGHTQHVESSGQLYSNTAFNVTAAGVAGGLIGDAGNAGISYSYSTCSATGLSAGGFVGTSTGTIEHCYATGLVKGTQTETVGEGANARTMQKDGAFAYSCTGTVSDCQFYEIVNERITAEAIDYLTSLGKGQSNGGITPLDDSPEIYDAFIGAAVGGSKGGWKKTNVYDTILTKYYGAGRFTLKTVRQLGMTGVVETADADHPVVDFVATHYGDWPAPEIFMFNVKDPTATP